MKTITTRIPEEDEETLKKMEKEEGVKRSEALRKLIEGGLKEWKIKRALELLKDHKVTLRKATEISGTTYPELLELASQEGLEAGYDLEELERDLGRV